MGGVTTKAATTHTAPVSGRNTPVYLNWLNRASSRSTAVKIKSLKRLAAALLHDMDLGFILFCFLSFLDDHGA